MTNTKTLLTLNPNTQSIKGSVSLPGSKSITNRAFLLAALAQGKTTLTGCLRSEDSAAFMAALQALGVSLNDTGDDIIIEGTGRFTQDKATVWCQDAGTAARFLVAACSAFPGEFQIDGTKRLCERPIAPLIQVLKKQGAEFSQTQLPCAINGGSLLGGELDIEASLSTQFVSALLMIAPFMKAPLKLNTTGLNRRAYIDITIQMMRQFGVRVFEKNGVFEIDNKQSYQPQTYAIEPDLSTASYFFAAAALTGGVVRVNHINRAECLQGDSRFLTVLEKMGCRITQQAQGVSVEGPKQLHGIEINMQDFSDPFMTLAAIAPFADSPTTITGLAHTRLQESDRIDAIATELTKLGIQVETGPDWIRVHPGKPIATKLYSHHDHRIAMSLSVLALKVPGIVLEDPDCVAKTCPDFYALLESLIS